MYLAHNWYSNKDQDQAQDEDEVYVLVLVEDLLVERKGLKQV